MADEVKVSNSTVGVINTGEIQEIKSVYLNTSDLTSTGHTKLATALRKVAEAVSESQELAEKQQTELLEQLREVAQQANKPPDDRVAPEVMKALLSGMATTICTVGALAEIWSTWGPAITKFFGF
jgi:hypothetical protein